MNLRAWPWHLILQWSSGVSALMVLGVIINSLYRERVKNPDGSDELMMFVAVFATTILTLSSLLNFLIFVLF